MGKLWFYIAVLFIGCRGEVGALSAKLCRENCNIETDQGCCLKFSLDGHNSKESKKSVRQISNDDYSDYVSSMKSNEETPNLHEGMTPLRTSTYPIYQTPLSRRMRMSINPEHILQQPMNYPMNYNYGAYWMPPRYEQPIAPVGSNLYIQQGQATNRYQLPISDEFKLQSIQQKGSAQELDKFSRSQKEKIIDSSGTEHYVDEYFPPNRRQPSSPDVQQQPPSKALHGRRPSISKTSNKEGMDPEGPPRFYLHFSLHEGGVAGKKNTKTGQ